jgi:hypothetical protein
MTETQSLTIDILKIVPDNSICYINAPSIDNSSAILNLLQPTELIYNKQIKLTKENKTAFINIVTSESIEEHFHNLQIKHNSDLLCEAFDGMDMVTLSKNINVTNEFIDKYIKTDLCCISNDW